MLKILALLAALMAPLAVFATTTEARSPNIHDRTVTVTETASNFTISGVATGLAGGYTYEVEVSGSVSGVYQCTNGGGNDPAPKGFSSPVSGTGTFTAQENGNLQFSVTTSVPKPSAAGTCSPSGNNWTVNLLSYSGTVNLVLCGAPNPSQPCTGANILDSVSGISVSYP